MQGRQLPPALEVPHLIVWSTDARDNPSPVGITAQASPTRVARRVDSSRRSRGPHLERVVLDAETTRCHPASRARVHPVGVGRAGSTVPATLEVHTLSVGHKTPRQHTASPASRARVHLSAWRAKSTLLPVSGPYLERWSSEAETTCRPSGVTRTRSPSHGRAESTAPVRFRVPYLERRYRRPRLHAAHPASPRSHSPRRHDAQGQQL